MRKYLVCCIALMLFGGACTHAPRVAQVPASPVPHPEVAQNPVVDDDDKEREKRRGESEREDEGEESESAKDIMRAFVGRRVLPGEELPAERYRAAMDHIAKMPRYSLSEGRQIATPESTSPTPPINLGGWTSLGPSQIGGRTRSLLVNPANPSIMLAGAVTGGIWKTTNGGASWANMTDQLPVTFIGSMTMDPSNSNTIYAGTGEWITSFRGFGILKSADGGNTWAVLPSTETPDFYYVQKVKVSPVNPQHIYAATNSGVMRSLDGGSTWTNILTVSNGPVTYNNLNANQHCDDIQIRKDQTTDVVFTTCAGGIYTTIPGGIWRNTDAAGSGTWTEVASLPTVQRTAIALAPSNQNIIYAVTVITATPSFTYINALGQVLQSTSGGDSGTWTVRTSNQDPVLLNTLILGYPAASCEGPTADTQKVGQGEYDLDLEVDPANSNKVWIGAVDIFRSDDGGANWGVASFWDARTNNVHADNHILVFDPGWNGNSDQTLYVGNDGGVWKSTNANAPTVTGTNAMCAVYSVYTGSVYTGATIAWTSLNNGYTTTQFYGGSVYPGGASYIGGTQDNSTLRSNPGLGAANWQSIIGGDGFIPMVDPLDSTTIYATTSTSLVLGRSNDGGQTFTNVSGGIADPFNDPLAYPPYTIDPTDTRRIYAGEEHLWRSADEGNTWTEASPITLLDVTAIKVSPANSNHLVMGTGHGEIWLTNVALTTTVSPAGWTFTQPRSGLVAAFAFDPTNDLNVYATYTTFNQNPGDNHVYRSRDGGFSWTGVDGTGASSIPDVPVSSVVVDPVNPATIYLGTDVGVFVSTDSGNTWSHDASSFSNTIISTLAIDRGTGVENLYAFTYGRGVWRATLGNSGTACTYSVSPTTVNADASGALNYVTVTTQPGCAWSADVNPPVYNNISAPPAVIFLQPPANGVGSGRAYFTLYPNQYSEVSSPGTITVAGTVVRVNQAEPDYLFTGSNDEASAAAQVASIPFLSVATSNNYTSNSTDPIHSCTGSRDFATAWWQYTATSNGTVSITAESFRVDNTSGDGGFVLTAYPKTSNGSPGAELGCSTHGRDTVVYPNPFAPPQGFTISATAGNTYLIEMSSTTIGLSEYLLFIEPSLGPESISVSPATLTMAIGATQQFDATTAGLYTSAVRWSATPPIGRIDSTGLFTAPANIAGATKVTITATSMADSTRTASATVTVTSPATVITAITNAATFAVTPVAPGELVTLFGSNLGPANLAGLQVTPSGTVATQVAGAQVFFDGNPAPIVYASSGQTTVVVPYEVYGELTTQVYVSYNGQTSPTVTVPVALASPGIFANPQLQAAIINGDGTVNSPQNPAAEESYIQLYATGEGQTNPSGVDGKVNNSAPLPIPIEKVQVTIDGIPAKILYAGAAGGAVSGVLQLNVEVPYTAGPVPAASVVLTIGGQNSPSNITMAIK